MDALEFGTRATVWAAVAAWAWVVGCRLAGRGLHSARWIWLAGAALHAVHAALAFERFYGWSHATALRETARVTLETTGFDSGAGLWLNYLFGVVWLSDALVWVFAGTDRYRRMPAVLRAAVDGFLAFLVWNGTVVFGEGPVRVFGVAVFAALLVPAAMRLRKGALRRSSDR